MLDSFRTKDKELFAQLQVITSSLVQAAELLHELLSGPVADAPETAAAAERLDPAPTPDGAVDVRAFTAFAMRLDPMEYRALAVALDTAFESVQGATAHAHALRAANAPPQLVALAALLVEAADALHDAVPDVGRKRGKGAEPVAGADLSERADALYYDGVAAQFSGVPDASAALRWKDVYDTVRKAVAKCADGVEVLRRLAR